MPNHGQGGRPSRDIEQYKDEILERVHTQRWKQQEVVTWLADNKDLIIDSRTLQRRLQKWGSQQQDRTKDTEQLRNRIQILFCRSGATDDEMLACLKEEGFTVASRGLVRIRLELGLKRLGRSLEARENERVVQGSCPPPAMEQLCRASVLHGPKNLRLQEKTLDSPGPTELQIVIRATGLCGSDLHYYEQYRNGDIQVKEPLSLGHESAGVVAIVGSQVEGYKVGDRVALEVGLPCGDCERCQEGRYNICQHLRFRSSAKAFPHFQGTLQDRINHPASWCHKLPDHVSFDVGAILEPLGVAIQASRRAQIAQESSTLVFGAGAVGLLCAAMAKVAGSSHVVIADIQQERVKFAIEHGFAHEAFTVPAKRAQNIDEKLQNAKETAASAAGEIRNGTTPTGGFDVVLECTGVEACTQAAIYATRPGGKVVIVGMGNPVQTLPISAAAHREVDILGTFRYANTYPQAIELVSGQNPLLPDLSQLVTHRFHGLDHVERAFEMAAKTEDDNGNLVLKVVIETDHC